MRATEDSISGRNDKHGPVLLLLLLLQHHKHVRHMCIYTSRTVPKPLRLCIVHITLLGRFTSGQEQVNCTNLKTTSTNITSTISTITTVTTTTIGDPSLCT